MKQDTSVQRLAFLSILVGIVVFVLKFGAYYVTGSVALYSDALESIINVVASLVAWLAIRLSNKPADPNHPHGHHKVEYFSAVLEGILIIGAAFLIMREVWLAWEAPKTLEQPWLGLGINGGASLINAFWATLLINRGRASKSPALLADGKLLMTDVWTSAGVFAGLAAGLLTGWSFVDPILGVLVVLNILYQGWSVIGNSVQGLMDVSLAPEESLRIRDIISANSGSALEIHALKARMAGRVTFIEFHLVVKADMTVGDAHLISDRIENALIKQIADAKVVIHIEPEDEALLPSGTVAVPFA